MRRGGALVLLAGGAAVVLMAIGLARVVQLRFELGDSYPESSSYRADPRGCKAYFEALSSLPGIAVERNLLPLPMRESSFSDASLLFLGVEGGENYLEWGAVSVSMEEPVVEEIEGIAESGARVVMTFRFTSRMTRDGVKIEEVTGPPTGGEDAGEGEAREKIEAMMGASRRVDLAARWGFAFGYEDRVDRPDGGWELSGSGALAGTPLPPWPDVWRLGALAPEWRTLATAGGHPVIVERDWGKGTIILVTSSVFASNQELMHGESTGLLAWLPGGRERIVFDETHLGSEAAPGIMALVARFRLQGIFVGVALLVVVYAWKNSRGLVPPDNAGEGRLYADATVMGSGAAAGLSRLLRRNLPAGALLETCYRTWFASRARSSRFSREVADEVIGIIEAERAAKPRKQNVVAAYNRVVEAVAKRTGGSPAEPR